MILYRKMLVACSLIGVLFGGMYIRHSLKTVYFYSIQKTIPSPLCSAGVCFSRAIASTNRHTLKKSPPLQNFSGFCSNVPVLLYHHIQPEILAKSKSQTSLSVDNGIFDAQMAYIASHGYTTLTAEQLIQALLLHTQLPSKSIVITLDDGYKDAYEYAYPIFQKYQLKANLMLPPGLLGGPNYLNWSQVEEMSKNPLISIANHTWSHAALGKATREKIKFEIENAAFQLEQHTGKRQTVFTYPYGSFGSEAISILREDGYLGAFSSIPGTTQCDSFIMTLHRTRIGNAPLSSYGL